MSTYKNFGNETDFSDRIYPGIVYYEIIGGAHPFVLPFLATEVIAKENQYFLPDKYIGKNSFSIEDFGTCVFADEQSANRFLEQNRRKTK